MLGPATLADVVLVCLADALVGLSFGAISVGGGLPFWVPVVMSLVVFAGGAQFAAVAAVLSGGGAAAGVLAGLVLNARLLPFGFAVADVLGGRGAARLLGAHLIVDESVAFAVRESDPVRRRAVFWCCGTALFALWNLGVLGGAWLGSVLRDPGAFGLDAAFPAVLLALVLPSLTARLRPAALVAALIAVAVTPFVPSGSAVLVALAALALVRRTGRPR